MAKKSQAKQSRTTNSRSGKGAKATLDQFKMEAASEVGVDLSKGDNGSITSRQAGSVGGQMVKKMVEKYRKDMNSK
ncbi:MAG: alpha/beta-type small acid-soluble spore protein [Clostridia bacterium]|nr:alpha/beta-type small acid-soluble spore protein [Clostridia bacterium]